MIQLYGARKYQHGVREAREKIKGNQSSAFPSEWSWCCGRGTGKLVRFGDAELSHLSGNLPPTTGTRARGSIPSMFLGGFSRLSCGEELLFYAPVLSQDTQIARNASELVLIA
jgi:hypothetical protein